MHIVFYMITSYKIRIKRSYVYELLLNRKLIKF